MKEDVILFETPAVKDSQRFIISVISKYLSQICCFTVFPHNLFDYEYFGAN
jgi:hypothetical protein